MVTACESSCGHDREVVRAFKARASYSQHLRSLPDNVGMRDGCCSYVRAAQSLFGFGPI